MPGSGINGKTVDSLVPLRLSEIHLSGGDWIEGEMIFRREGMGMGVGGKGEWGVFVTNEEKVKEVKAKVDGHI